jgi:hypothetical protein
MAQPAKKQNKQSSTKSKSNSKANYAQAAELEGNEPVFSLSTPIAIAMLASTVGLMMLTATLYFPELFALVHPFASFWSLSPLHIRSMLSFLS